MCEITEPIFLIYRFHSRLARYLRTSTVIDLEIKFYPDSVSQIVFFPYLAVERNLLRSCLYATMIPDQCKCQAKSVAFQHSLCQVAIS